MGGCQVNFTVSVSAKLLMILVLSVYFSVFCEFPKLFLLNCFQFMLKLLIKNLFLHT